MRKTYGIPETKKDSKEETIKNLCSDMMYYLDDAKENIEVGNYLYAKTCLRDTQRALLKLRELI